MHLSPVDYAAFVFGGYSGVGRALGIQRMDPYRWAHLPHVNGAGFIPAWHQRPLLSAARERGLDLTEHDLIHGREVADALLVGRINAPRLPALA